MQKVQNLSESWDNLLPVFYTLSPQTRLIQDKAKLLYIHLVVVDKAQSVAMFKLDIFHNILLLLFTCCLSVGVSPL